MFSDEQSSDKIDFHDEIGNIHADNRQERLFACKILRQT